MPSGGPGVSLLPLALPERPADRAFTLQYTTLILIIITFIVGAFGGQKVQSKMMPIPSSSAPAPKSPGARDEREGRVPSDSIQIEHLFRAASVELDTAKGAAIAAVLKSHDIDAEIDIVADSMGEDDYRIALRQGRTLLKFLLEAGVPAGAFRVYLVESRVPEWAAAETASHTTIRFYRGGPDGAP